MTIKTPVLKMGYSERLANVYQTEGLESHNFPVSKVKFLFYYKGVVNKLFCTRTKSGEKNLQAT